ncbi:glycoside hydrolase family 3 N-terminal domain-containing protein [Fulvivirga sediminis]|uniref:beta-glucosidase n=1 Tax=Fulvivirga sediminis TaxID=2803949 RepID=A0A937FC23_9BACT|nr:glycoside hydrolase family 3 N-terminal domain-containing protein [Fulvivirga sediminis]MBL3658927.1 glycoside hydrolase family 3 C-terminal domain-containing protein [Fulvivirga sediminis]
MLRIKINLLTAFCCIFIIIFSQSAYAQQLNDPVIEKKVNELLSKMSLEDKIGQTALRGTSSRSKGLSDELKDAVRRGQVGALLNVMNTEHVKELQDIAVNESPNKIPLIFARDIIHGFKTIFPIPLGQAATWDSVLVAEGSRIAAKEATAKGIRWTFAPMVDIARDPRWGRIAESPGEDPYLASVLSRAYIRGFQGNDLASPTSMLACAKHFAAYGAAEGGRDYNTAIVSDDLLYNIYLKPFKAALDADVGTFMSSFNDLNGIPATGNKFLLQEVLRNQWGFKGFVVSDWNSVTEMIPHGYARDEKEAALKAASAGLDMEMTSQAYENHLAALISSGEISMQQLDELVRNILRIKFRMGLFENPGFTEKDLNYHPDHLEAAKKAAIESIVLLKNQTNILPLNFNKKKVVVIGPLADAPHEQLGTWTFDGEKEHTQTVWAKLKSTYDKDHIKYTPGLKYSRDKSKDGFTSAIEAAKDSDAILFVGGEEAILSGEAHSRANLNLPGIQEELIHELAKTGKPIILVVMAGRPITVGNIINDIDALVMAWHPGTMGGPALVDVLSGITSPSGRLPVTWPKTAGQAPIYYNHTNTGRPASKDNFVHMDDIPVGAWQSSLGNNSHYLDAGYAPMYPFGYGLTYSKFQYTNLSMDADTYSTDDELKVTFTLTNTGKTEATEIVQYYVQDKFGSTVRPIRELVGFERVHLKAGESRNISFELPISKLAFYNAESKWVVEPGEFNLWVAPNAAEGLEASFVVK